MSRIKYTCKNCGWMTSVVAQWADLKPKRCMNAKCNTSFVRESQSLLVDDPTKAKLAKPKVKVDNEKAISKFKSSGKAKQQQVKQKSDL